MPLSTLSESAEQQDTQPSALTLVREETWDRALSVIEDAEEREQRNIEFDTWVRTVREPATYRSEGPRRIVAGGRSGARAEYEIAPLPDGRWAIRYHVDFPGYSGGGSPWTAHATREECLEDFRAHVRRRCDEQHGSCITNANKRAIPILRQIVDPSDLFGFQEPAPEPRGEWYPEMIADQLDSLARDWNIELLDVVRGGSYKPISKSGSFFDIPLPAGVKDSWHGDEEGEGEEPYDEE